MLFSFLIVVAFCLLALSAKADGPSKKALEHLDNIKANQLVIEENRAAHELFMQAKGWNEAEVAAINAEGWSVQWDTMQLVPVQEGF